MQLTAQVQRRLWGTDARSWADLAEVHNRPLFAAVLDAAGVGAGTKLLDIGCGSGLALVMAGERGAHLTGIDVTPELLAIARERLPQADLRDGDMEELPFADGAFDAAIGVNAFQFAGDPARAFAEAARVVRPGGVIVASLFAEPERCEGTVAHEAMARLIPPEKAGDHAPYSLSDRLHDVIGLPVIATGEVECVWAYRDMDEAVRALLCSAGGARALEAADEDAVRAAIVGALAPFDHDGIRLRNVFRWVAARR